MKLPKLERLAMRPEEEVPPDQKEQWKPSWKCFCCQDTGKVSPHLARLVIPNYNYDRDRFPICQNCNLGHEWLHLEGCYDSRLTSDICKELDQIARDDWEQTRRKWHKSVKTRLQLEINSVTKNMSLRKRSRTHEEQQLAQYRHELVRTDRYELEKTV